MTEEEAPLGESQGLTRVAQQDSAVGSADPAGAPPGSQEPCLPGDERRRGGRLKRRPRLSPPHLQAVRGPFGLSLRGPGRAAQRPVLKLRSLAGRVAGPAPRHTPPTTAQAIPVSAACSGCRKFARGPLGSDIAHASRHALSTTLPRRPFSHYTRLLSDG